MKEEAVYLVELAKIMRIPGRVFSDAEYKIAAAALEDAAARLTQMEPVVRAACAVVQADTYKHPILSRADAAAAGVDALHDAVNKYRVLSTPQARQPDPEGDAPPSSSASPVVRGAVTR